MAVKVISNTVSSSVVLLSAIDTGLSLSGITVSETVAGTLEAPPSPSWATNLNESFTTESELLLYLTLFPVKE